MKELCLQVSGMKCEGCEKRIENALTMFEEVREVKADHKTGTVKIIFSSNLSKELQNKVIQKIEDLDFEVFQK